MPYITQDKRSDIEENVTHQKLEVIGYLLDNEGELNYVFSSIIKGYLQKMGTSYQVYNEIIGVLECAKLELYRHHIGPYEQSKIEENGDL